MKYLKFIFLLICLLHIVIVKCQYSEPYFDNQLKKYYFGKETVNDSIIRTSDYFDKALEFYGHYTFVKKDKVWFLINDNLKYVGGPFEYIDEDFYMNNYETPVKENGKWNVLNYKGKKLLKHAVPDSNFFYTPDDNTYFYSTQNTVFRADRKKKKWVKLKCSKYYEDATEVIECDIVNWIYTFDPSNKLAAVKTDKFGYIDLYGNKLAPFEYDYAEGFNSDNLALVAKNGYYGFINLKREIQIPLIYKSGNSFYNKMAIVSDDTGYFIIDINGNKLNKKHYQSLSSSKVNPDKFIAQLGYKFGVIAQNDQIIVPFEYKKLDYINGYTFVAQKNNYGLIDLSNKVVIPFNYDAYSTRLIYYNIIIFQKNADSLNNLHIFNTNGNQLDQKGYSDIGFMYNGLVKVKQGKQFGFIDQTGKEIIPCIYDEVQTYFTNKIKVKLDGKEFYIDKTGKKVEN